jgi:hypothetical protein
MTPERLDFDTHHYGLEFLDSLGSMAQVEIAVRGSGPHSRGISPPSPRQALRISQPFEGAAVQVFLPVPGRFAALARRAG